MCYTDEDDELWQEDPYEFIRVKYGKHNFSIFIDINFMKMSQALLFGLHCKNSYCDIKQVVGSLKSRHYEDQIIIL